jgi:hypothetical protein
MAEFWPGSHRTRDDYAGNCADISIHSFQCGDSAVTVIPSGGSFRDLVSLMMGFAKSSTHPPSYTMRHGQTEPGPPSIVSTVKINQAGFTEMMDTEAMFRKRFGSARASRLLP